MSSHHIVRDQQEPALIIHRLDNQHHEILGPLLEWSPTVLCCQPGLETYITLGHKLDVALIGLSHLDKWKRELESQQPIKIMAVNDPHFLSTGLTILQREGHKSVNILTDKDSVFDVIELVLDWVSHFDLVIFTPEEKHIIVNSNTFKKWLPSESEVSVISFGEEALVSSAGFDEDFNEATGDEFSFKKSNEGNVQITSTQFPFMVIEHL